MRAFVIVCAAILSLSSVDVLAKRAPDNPVSLPADVVGAPAETLGTVIGTLGYRDDHRPIVGNAALFFRRVGSADMGSVRVNHGMAKLRGDAGALNVKGGDLRYTAFKMALPEGQYELIGVMGSYGIMPGPNSGGPFQIPKGFGVGTIDSGGVICGLGSSGDLSMSDVFSVPFEVKRGGVVYLGSFAAHGTTTSGKGCFIPMPVPSTIYFSWADKWQRDQVAFAEGELAVDASLVEHPALAVNSRTAYFIFAEDHLPEARPTTRDYFDGRTSHAGKIALYRAAHPGEPEVAAPPTAAGAATPAVESPAGAH